MIPTSLSETDILTTKEVAALLKVSTWTILELVRQNKIPHRSIGKQPRFPAWLIIEWFDQWKLETEAIGAEAAGAAAAKAATLSPADLLNAVQTAKLLGVSPATIYEITRQNKIPHRMIGKQPRYPVWLIIDWFHSWQTDVGKL